MKSSAICVVTACAGCRRHHARITDIVGLSTDVSGIVMEVSVHDSQKIAQKAANGDVQFKLTPCSFN